MCFRSIRSTLSCKMECCILRTSEARSGFLKTSRRWTGLPHRTSSCQRPHRKRPCSQRRRGKVRPQVVSSLRKQFRPQSIRSINSPRVSGSSCRTNRSSFLRLRDMAHRSAGEEVILPISSAPARCWPRVWRPGCSLRPRF